MTEKIQYEKIRKQGEYSIKKKKKVLRKKKRSTL